VMPDWKSATPTTKAPINLIDVTLHTAFPSFSKVCAKYVPFVSVQR
jgi:hypothetical protein